MMEMFKFKMNDLFSKVHDFTNEQLNKILNVFVEIKKAMGPGTRTVHLHFHRWTGAGFVHLG